MRLFFSLKGFRSRQARKQHPDRPTLLHSFPATSSWQSDRNIFFCLVLLSAFCEEVLRGISNCELFLCAPQPSGEKWMKIAIRNQATSFPSFFSHRRKAFLALSTSSSHESCDCRLEKLEIIDFECAFAPDMDHLWHPSQPLRGSMPNFIFLVREHRVLSTTTPTHTLSDGSLIRSFGYLPFFCEMKFR